MIKLWIFGVVSCVFHLKCNACGNICFEYAQQNTLFLSQHHSNGKFKQNIKWVFRYKIPAYFHCLYISYVLEPKSSKYLYETFNKMKFLCNECCWFFLLKTESSHVMLTRKNQIFLNKNLFLIGLVIYSKKYLIHTYHHVWFHSIKIEFQLKSNFQIFYKKLDNLPPVIPNKYHWRVFEI